MMLPQWTNIKRISFEIYYFCETLTTKNIIIMRARKGWDLPKSNSKATFRLCSQNKPKEVCVRPLIRTLDSEHLWIEY